MCVCVCQLKFSGKAYKPDTVCIVCCQRILKIFVVYFFSYIDQGKNPNLYTKDCLEKALSKNEQVKGKIDNLKVMYSFTVQNHSSR